MSRWESLLAVQGHDTHIDQLRHRSASLPGRPELTRNAEAVAALDQRIASVESRRIDLSRSQQRLEDEVALLTERAAQADKRLYSGTVSNPRELQALQDDIASLKRRISQLEDEELEIMELTEPVEAERAELDGERAALTAEGDRLRRPRRALAGVRAAAGRPRRRRDRPPGGTELPGLSPVAAGGRGRPHPAPAGRRAGPLRGVRPPPRARLTRRCSSGSSGVRSSACGWCSRALPSTTAWSCSAPYSRCWSCRSASPASSTA